MKKIIFIAGLLFVSAPVFAEDKPQEYQLSLSGQEIAYIGGLLSKQPYAEVSQLIAKLQTQIAQKKHDEPAKK